MGRRVRVRGTCVPSCSSLCWNPDVRVFLYHPHVWPWTCLTFRIRGRNKADFESRGRYQKVERPAPQAVVARGGCVWSPCVRDAMQPRLGGAHTHHPSGTRDGPSSTGSPRERLVLEAKPRDGSSQEPGGGISN